MDQTVVSAVIGARANGRPVVLLVEDEAEIVGLMRDFLEAEGFEVHAAANGSAAVVALTTRASGRDRRPVVACDLPLVAGTLLSFPARTVGGYSPEESAPARAQPLG